MSQPLAAVVVVGACLFVAACGSSSKLPALTNNDGCTAGSCADAGGDDDGTVIEIMPPYTAPGFVDPLVDGGETTGAIGGGVCPTTTVYPAGNPIVTPDVPVCCSNGFELGDPKASTTYTIASSAPGGSPAVMFDLDIATYQQADRITMSATTAAGTTPIFDSCELKTWDMSDTTNGLTRPTDASIRQFHVDVPAGTTSLTFDFSGVTSPSYIRALGLCDFNVVRGDAKGVSWRAVASLDDGGSCQAEASDDAGADGGASIR